MSTNLKDRVESDSKMMDAAYYIALIQGHPSIDSVVDEQTLSVWSQSVFTSQERQKFLSDQIVQISRDDKISISDAIVQFLKKNPDLVPRFAVRGEHDLLIQNARTCSFGEDHWLILNGQWIGKLIAEYNGYENGIYCKETKILKGPVIELPGDTNLALAKIAGHGFLAYNTTALIDALQELGIVELDSSKDYTIEMGQKATEEKISKPGF